MSKIAFPALILACLASGCDSHEAKAAPHAAKAALDDRALCVDVFTRARACTADFIPVLVDARARHDRPTGIAAAVQADRASVIAQAMQEWANDSTDAAISMSCDRWSSKVTDDDQAAARRCLAAATCAAFTTCVMPVIEDEWTRS
jgi:hypothetical protein